MKLLNTWRQWPPKRKFLTSAAAMAALYAAAIIGDSASRDIDLPLVPSISLGGKELPPLESHGDPLSIDEIRIELLNAFPGIKPHDIQLADLQYQPVEYEDFLRLADWVGDFYADNPQLHYTAEGYDCDNFARTFVVIADLASPERFRGQLAMMRLYVEQRNAWGGVPASTGTHALIAFRHGDGWSLYEPQSREVVRVADYPNQPHVRRVIGD